MIARPGVHPRRSPWLRTRCPTVVLRRPATLASGGLVALAFASFTAPAWASPDLQNFSNEGRADVLFHAGEKKFDSGDFAGACKDFSESLKLGPKLGTLLNLALCHATVGRTVTAWREFSHAAAWAAQNNQRDRLDFATMHIRSLEPRLPRIVLQLPADRPLESIDVDGEPLPEQQWYLPLFLDPGEHSLAATAPGKKRASVTFRVVASPTEQLIMVPSLKDDTDHPALARTVDPTRRTIGAVLLGFGGTGVILGTLFGIGAATTDDPDTATSGALAGTVAFGAGALLLFAGGWLYWSSQSGSRTALSVGPRRSGGSLTLTSSF
jgi:hypothetical protein